MQASPGICRGGSAGWRQRRRQQGPPPGRRRRLLRRVPLASGGVAAVVLKAMLAVCGARRADWRRSGPPLAAAACIRLLTAAPSCWRSACASPSSAPAPFRKAACRTLASRERAWIAGGECKGQGLCCRWCWRGPDSPGSVPRWCSAAWPAPRGPCNPARRCQTVAHAMRHRLGSPGWCGPAADTCRRRSRPCRRWRPCGGRSAQCTLNEHQPSFPHPHTWCVVELEWFVGLLRCLARRAPLASGCLRRRRRASKCAQCAKWCVCIQFVLLKVWLVAPAETTSTTPSHPLQPPKLTSRPTVSTSHNTTTPPHPIRTHSLVNPPTPDDAPHLYTTHLYTTPLKSQPSNSDNPQQGTRTSTGTTGAHNTQSAISPTAARPPTHRRHTRPHRRR